jgi:ribonuclease HI
VVVKTREDEELISDLTETFDNLRKFKMKLNPEKCTFGVPLGKLLGYMVSRQGIDPNPEKVSAITRMAPPESLHDIQKLTGCMAALSRFISRLGVRGLPFFKLLKKQDKFQWTKEAQEAFEDLKKYLTTPPTLVAPEPHENLQLYILATSNVVGMTIVVERGESGINRKIQYPVYFISEVLSDSKTRYFHIMKLAYALLITSHKLSHYFQAHQIEVHISAVLGEILNNREATEKIAKWAIELSMYDIVYKPRTAIKAQALSDFVAERTETQTLPKERELEYWTINFDGSLQLQGVGAGILVTSPKGENFKYVLQMHFSATNNAAEYEALLYGLRIAMALDIHRLRVFGDSLLIVNQANKEWSCLDDKMTMYCQELRKLENNFDGLKYLHILRGCNEVTDELAKLGSSRAVVPAGVFMQEFHEPSIAKALAKANKAAESSQEITPPAESISESPEVMEVHSDWRTLFLIYLRTRGLPDDKDERERLRRRAGHYTLVNDELFRRSTNGTLMRCILPEEGCSILQDIHSGICGTHVGARTLVGKTYRQGFYWPTAVSNADYLVRRCEGCQFFARQKHMPSHQLQTIPIT